MKSTCLALSHYAAVALQVLGIVPSPVAGVMSARAMHATAPALVHEAGVAPSQEEPSSSVTAGLRQPSWASCMEGLRAGTMGTVASAMGWRVIWEGVPGLMWALSSGLSRPSSGRRGLARVWKGDAAAAMLGVFSACSVGAPATGSTVMPGAALEAPASTAGPGVGEVQLLLGTAMLSNLVPLSSLSGMRPGAGGSLASALPVPTEAPSSVSCEALAG